MNRSPIFQLDHAWDVCDVCGKDYRNDVGHWCPESRPDVRGESLVDTRWKGDRWFFCQPSLARLVADFTRIGQPTWLFNREQANILVVCMPPPTYVSIRTAMVEHNLTAREALMLHAGLSVDQMLQRVLRAQRSIYEVVTALQVNR